MTQSNWQYCKKCEGLFFAGNSLGVCPAGGNHDDSASGDYALPDSGVGQSGWKWCSRCQGLFFASSAGVCPSRVGQPTNQPSTHDSSTSGDYVLAAALGSSNNAILVNNCQNLENLSVSLVVSEDLVTQGNTGIQ